MQFRMTLSVAACALFAGLSASAAQSDEIYEGVVRTSQYIAVRDGTKLAVNVYRPAIDGVAVDKKLPVIFSATPYRARYTAEDGSVSDMAMSDRLGLRSSISHGYVVVTADIRGKGASYGARRGFQDRTEAHDHYDLIEWAAEQPWSDGNVGMTGCSYLGGATMQAATVEPPHLKAVFVGASDYDKYTFVRRGEDTYTCAQQEAVSEMRALLGLKPAGTIDGPAPVRSVMLLSAHCTLEEMYLFGRFAATECQKASLAEPSSTTSSSAIAAGNAALKAFAAVSPASSRRYT